MSDLRYGPRRPTVQEETRHRSVAGELSYRAALTVRAERQRQALDTAPAEQPARWTEIEAACMHQVLERIAAGHDGSACGLAREALDRLVAEQPAEGVACETCDGTRQSGAICEGEECSECVTSGMHTVPCPDCATPAPEPDPTHCPVHGAGVPVDARGRCEVFEQPCNDTCGHRAAGPGAEAAVRAHFAAEEYLRQLGQAGEVIRQRTSERNTAIAEAERLERIRREQDDSITAYAEEAEQLRAQSAEWERQAREAVEALCRQATELSQALAEGLRLKAQLGDHKRASAVYREECNTLAAQLAEAQAEVDRMIANALEADHGE